MPSITFGYDPKKSILEQSDNFLKGTNPIHNIATGEIIGKLAFTYTSQKLWDPNDDNKYFNSVILNILLDKLQNPNGDRLEFNSLDSIIYFE